MYTSRSLPSGRHLSYREGHASEPKRPRRPNPPTKRWKHEALVVALGRWLREGGPVLKGSFTVEEASDALQARKGDISRAMQELRLCGFRFVKGNSLPHDVHRYPSAYANAVIERGHPPPRYLGSPSSGWQASSFEYHFSGP